MMVYGSESFLVCDVLKLRCTSPINILHPISRTDSGPDLKVVLSCVIGEKTVVSRFNSNLGQQKVRTFVFLLLGNIRVGKLHGRKGWDADRKWHSKRHIINSMK